MEEPNGRKSVLIFSHFVYINPTYSNNSLKIVSNNSDTVLNKLSHYLLKTVFGFIIEM